MKRSLIILSMTSCLLTTEVEGTWTFQEGRFVRIEDIPTLSPGEHYQKGLDALNAKNWEEAEKQFHIVSINFPRSTYGQDALYYLGIVYYHLGEYDFANDALTQYLHCQTNPQYFQEAIEYKFYIAEQFRCGARKHFWGTKQMPKWGSGVGLATEIYDEVISTLPNHEVAARALYYKGCHLWKQKDYRESIETFQTLIRRFPKHELTPESFLCINKIYLEQSQKEFQNPDLIALAEINQRRFEEQFPRDERLSQSHADVLKIKEHYAKGLYETASFYERVRQPQAAAIYYQKAMVEYPDTRVAKRCRGRLKSLNPRALDNEQAS